MDRRDFLKYGAALGTTLKFPPAFSNPANAASEGPLLKVSFAERDITPDVGMEMPGGYGKSYSKGFHDRCKVRAAVLDDRATRVALVGLDAVGIPRMVVQVARQQIQERCGIPPTAVLIGASHSHSSGPLAGVLPRQYDHASGFVQHLAYDMSTVADTGYIQRVEEQIAGAVCEANNTLVEARCGAETGREDRVAFNRRLRMKNGTTYTHPGQGNPDIIGYAGPIDPQVGVIGAWDTRGRLLGCIVNYTCHCTTNPGSGSDISANWVYFMEEAIRGALGTEVPVVFLQGAAGDVTQVDNLSPYENRPREQWAQFVGGRVGAEAAKVLWSMTPGSLTPVDAKSTVLDIKRRVPSPEHVQHAYNVVKQARETVDPTEWAFAKEIVLLDALLKTEPFAEVEVQAIQVGPAVLVSNPAELFCQYGLNLKAKSQFPHTYVVSYADGSVGYVPTEEAFGPHGGGYETRLTSHSNLEVTAGTQMVEAGLALVAQMTPGTAPTPPKAAPFNAKPDSIGSHPWSYGNVPPQID
jgi:hypothetical protein